VVHTHHFCTHLLEQSAHTVSDDGRTQVAHVHLLGDVGRTLVHHHLLRAGLFNQGVGGEELVDVVVELLLTDGQVDEAWACHTHLAHLEELVVLEMG